MAQITPAIRRAHGLAANLVPTDVLAQISQEELIDRLTHAKSLVRKSQDPALSPAERRGHAEQARAMMRAQPRAATEREVQALIAKAAGLGRIPQADACRQRAQQLLEEHPPAPRRAEAAAVAKAKMPEQDMMVVFDPAGRLLGICPRSKVQPVIGASASRAPDDAANTGAGEVAKARRGAPAPRTARR